MSIKPPLTDLPISTASSGFYEGFNTIVTIGSKLLVGLLIIWAAAFPENAGAALSALNGFLLGAFGTWYIYVMAFYLITCLALALWPATGRIRLGLDGEAPEFSTFSWFSMMFGAGIGIGMLTYSTGEPIYHFSTNPDVITGLVAAESAEVVRSAFKWSFLHWGLTAWGCYALTGLALAFFSYRRGLPLTIRSGLTPLFGSSLTGPLGHAIDIVAVIATVLGVAVTIGFGVSQFASGFYNITGADWLMQEDGTTPSNTAMILSLVVVMGLSTLSALSGVGKGIKWLSNMNMGLTFFFLAFLLVFGSTLFSLTALFVGIGDYLGALPGMMFTVWHADGTETGDALAAWQGGWTIFYWAWWIAFVPFVGLFLARISRGRTLREYVMGAMIVPSVMCFIWFAMAGGTAMDLELNGGANRAILDAGLSSQLFATVNQLLSPALAVVMSALLVVLLLTYLVTSADSAILIINTINAAGDETPKGKVHILVWGAALTLVISVLLVAGGLSAIQTAMIIGALPFSFVLALMGVALIKALIRDAMRAKAGLPAE
ncbi:BCCT family transporter [Rhodobacter sp. HX-7-19]|uniref:BCCT family transporter n=1 Tax=Paragemmobacter kunshanensis TaxID=2583234 RepID=A0A6M1TR13_9RHOB|nr:BCCT family transporter [Rhodobacter kunshanensis]NGQ90317.1 BCCT family transporter [Rhodobacter kunshanensis]